MPVDPWEVPERVFQAQVMELAARFGWRVAHFRPSQTRDGRWLTAISGDPGYPDLTLVHPRRGVIFAELKTATGRPTREQLRWLEALAYGSRVGTHVALWRPDDLQAIAELLSTPTAETAHPPAAAPARARKAPDTPPGRAESVQGGNP